jgi:hypothetical protein
MSDAPKIEAAVKVVAVGCKIPTGLHLDLVANDGAKIRHTLKGANAARIVGGYGITENIPVEFMERWLKKNSRHPAVLSGAIFYHTDVNGAKATAKERCDLVTGLEPIDPLKTGMLRGPDGENDRAAVADYNELKSKNPDRNRQQVE